MKSYHTNIKINFNNNMKKLFTLGLTLLMAAASYAQGDVRTLWDFTQGFSSETIANLEADAASGAGYWTNKGTWYESKARAAGPLYASVNGQDWLIPETEGLTIGAQSNAHFNIVIEHNDGPHIWLNGRKGEDYVTIPAVPAGEKVTIVYASHSGEEARGFKVSSGFASEDGKTEFKIVGKKDTVVVINNNADPADLKLSATNGFHIFYICVGDAPTGGTPKIGYVYDSSTEAYASSGEAEGYGAVGAALQTLGQLYDHEVVNIDLSKDVSAFTVDSLRNLTAVLLSPYVNADDEFLQNVKQAIAFTPVLNLSPDFYTTWGYGSAVASTSNMVQVKGAALESSLFQRAMAGEEPFLNEDGTIEWLYPGYNATGYSAPAGSYFAADSVLAYTMDGTPAIHIHNLDRNAYLLLPFPRMDEVSESGSSIDMIANGLMMLAGTKSEVAQAYRPSVSQTYHHQYTTVTLDCSTKGAQMYYTIDGSEPTTASTPYTAPFDINAKGVTVKAVAIADGYLLSDVREQAIDIYELADAPKVEYTQESGKSTVTITPAHEGDVVYYNYRSSNDPKQSATYTQPLVLAKHATVTAFTAARDADGLLQSELVTVEVPVQGEKVRLDVVSHMDANSGDYNVDIDGYPYYTDEVLEQTEDTIIFKPADTPTYHNPGTGWQIKTYGQPVIWQNNTAGHNVLDFNAYNPQTAEDDSENEITNNCVSFQGVTESNLAGVPDPASASIQSTVAFQAPFDVVVYMAGYNAKAGVYVTADTLNGEWTKLGNLIANDITGTADNGKDGKDRIWKKTILSYEGTDMVYVKVASEGGKAMIFDIFVKNEGEKSHEYTGIEDVTISGKAAGAPVSTEVYSVNGARLAKAATGLNIVKETYADGSVKTRKVVVK